MQSGEFIKKIRNYSFISFLLPLITIVICLNVYKLLGNISLYPNYNWDKKIIETSVVENKLISSDRTMWSFTNCPKYKYRKYLLGFDEKIFPANDQLGLQLYKENKINTLKVPINIF